MPRIGQIVLGDCLFGNEAVKGKNASIMQESLLLNMNKRIYRVKYETILQKVCRLCFTKISNITSYLRPSLFTLDGKFGSCSSASANFSPTRLSFL